MEALMMVVSLLLLQLCSSQAKRASAHPPPPPDELVADVLVYAANPAGIAAAIAAADLGQNKVVLMEPLSMIGGMGAAGGVGLMNQGCGLQGVTGLGREWAILNGRHYHGNTTPPVLNVFPDMYVAEQSFWQMLKANPSISTFPGCRLVKALRDDVCITEAHFLCDGEDSRLVSVKASIFIDASYDGDIMTMAGGIDYTSGRESRDTYNESLAGVSLLDYENESFDKQNLTVDATFSNGTLLPGISARPLLPAGTGDNRLMAFQYFACLSNTPGNMVPFPRPSAYNPGDFTLLQRQIDGVVSNGRYPLGPELDYFASMPAYDTSPHAVHKVLMCCGVGPVNCDQPGLNDGWAHANHSERLRMAALHKYYLLGSLYYMANEPAVPQHTRDAVKAWGLCMDEYANYGHWPPQLYIRISNRLQGEVMLTQNNIANPRSKADSVSMGCWEFDQHTVSRHSVPDPRNTSRLIARNEGYFRYDLQPPDKTEQNWYDVPFGVTLPKRGQVNNLMVPVALSASSVAYASTRIEGMFMDLGTATGVAAALALKQQRTHTLHMQQRQRSEHDVNAHTQTVGSGSSFGSARLGQCPAVPLQDTDVTAVQHILVTQYKQRVHGPI